jgi:hypothetical protein
MGTNGQGRQRAAGLMLLGMLALGCAKGPSFSYDMPPDAALGRYRTVALDPRRDVLAPALGKRPVDPRAFQGLVKAALEAKGYRVVPPDAAELWVEVFVLAPEPGEGRAAGAGAGRKGGRGKRGGQGGGAWPCGGSAAGVPGRFRRGGTGGAQGDPHGLAGGSGAAQT